MLSLALLVPYWIAFNSLAYPRPLIGATGHVPISPLLFQSRVLPGGAPTGTVTAPVAGTANTVAKFTGASTVGNSSITDNGTTVTVGELTLNVGNSAFTQPAILWDTSNASYDWVVQGGSSQGLRFLNSALSAWQPISTGGLQMIALAEISWASSTNPESSKDLFLTRPAPATLQLGAVNAASPVAQTLAFQGTRAGLDSDAAGVTSTIRSSLGTGSAASGPLVFSVGTPQASGTTQHVAAAILTLSNTGVSGTALGIAQLTAQKLTTGTMTAETEAALRCVVNSYTWTNAMVTALGANPNGDITVATLPAKTVVKNAYTVITGACAGGTIATCTAAVGRTSASYIDYIVASDATAAANTVYGDGSAERGTNLTGYDLPSYTATTAVKMHIIVTGDTLDHVTGSTGRVILETCLAP